MAHLISFIFFLSLKSPYFRPVSLAEFLLPTITLSTMALILFAMFLLVIPHPDTVIDGLQGQYYLLPSILITYVINNNLASSDLYRRHLLAAVLLPLGIYGFINTDKLLLDRYCLPSESY